MCLALLFNMFFFIVSIKFNYIDFLEHTERLSWFTNLGKRECTVTVVNNDNGSHCAHKRRQMGQERKREEGCERQKGTRGRTGHHKMWFVKPKWGKAALTHLLSRIRNKKQNKKINHQYPSRPTYLEKQQHWLWKTEEIGKKNWEWRDLRGGGMTTLRILNKQETDARGGSRSGGRRWDHIVWSFNMCVTGGQAKGCRRGEKGDGSAKIQRRWEREEEKLNGPFFCRT